MSIGQKVVKPKRENDEDETVIFAPVEDGLKTGQFID